MLIENRKEPPRLLTVNDPVQIKSTGQIGVIEAVTENGIYIVRLVSGGEPVRETYYNLTRRQVLMG